MASQQKLRSHQAWQTKYGGIPRIRRGASVFVYSPSSSVRPDTSFGAPSMHPCTLDDPLEQQKTRVCWNDARAIWKEVGSYQSTGDELLIRFEVLTNAPLQGRCYGIFYSPAKNAYIAALREDVTRFIAAPFTKSTREGIERTATLELPVETPEEIQQLVEVEARVERADAEVELLQRRLLQLVPSYLQEQMQYELRRPPHKERTDEEGNFIPAERVKAYQNRVENFLKLRLEVDTFISEGRREDIFKLIERYKAALLQRDQALLQMDKVRQAREPLVKARGQRDAALVRQQKMRMQAAEEARLFDIGYELAAPTRPGEERGRVFPQPSESSRALPAKRPFMPAPEVPSRPWDLTREKEEWGKGYTARRIKEAQRLLAKRKLEVAQELARSRASSLIPPATEAPVERFDSKLAQKIQREQEAALIEALEFLIQPKRPKSMTRAEIDQQRKELLDRYYSDPRLVPAVKLIMAAAGNEVKQQLIRERLYAEQLTQGFWINPEKLDGLRGMTRSTGFRRLWER